MLVEFCLFFKILKNVGLLLVEIEFFNKWVWLCVELEVSIDEVVCCWL